MAHDVFISYSTRDKIVADAVCAKLEASQVRCWLAPRDILAGSNYTESIIRGIESARILLLVFTESANQSKHVMREVERALNHNLAIIPFRTQDVVPSGSLEYLISTCHWLDAMSPPLGAHIDRLVQVVRAHLQGGVAVAPSIEAGRAPALREKLRIIFATQYAPHAEDIRDILAPHGIDVELVPWSYEQGHEYGKHRMRFYHQNEDESRAIEIVRQLDSVGIGITPSLSEVTVRRGRYALWLI